ncbi:MAG: hypothetical protein OEY36_06630 [Gammaproteobacteria bacterium]|nr:hypothetical protein [Gammaproteobacteria bacterium]
MLRMTLLTPLFFSLLTFLLAGCSAGGSSSPVDTTLDVTVTIPSAITTAALPTQGTLKVYINEQGQTPVEMALSGNSATYIFTGLPSGLAQTITSYEVSIVFESVLYSQAVVVLATASNQITISSGNNYLAFPDSIIDLNLDDDSDFKNNLAEVVTGTSPFVPICVVGMVNQLGSCELDI